MTRPLISAINYLTEYKRDGTLYRTHEGAPVRIFRDFMTGPALPTIMAQFTPSSNDADKQESSITAYVGVVRHLLKC